MQHQFLTCAPIRAPWSEVERTNHEAKLLHSEKTSILCYSSGVALVTLLRATLIKTAELIVFIFRLH